MRERSIADQRNQQAGKRKQAKRQRGRNTPSRSDVLKGGRTMPPGDRGSRELESGSQGAE
jgi:hypothetical protein